MAKVIRLNVRSQPRNSYGITLISVMLLLLGLFSLGVLMVKGSIRGLNQAGQLIARDRALSAAKTAAAWAAGKYQNLDDSALTKALMGYNPQGAECTSRCGDCMPGDNGIFTGQRNRLLYSASDCGGKPCMRQGAIARLMSNVSQMQMDVCEIPLTKLVASGEPDAQVSIWIRNNQSDVFGATPGASGQWTIDGDNRVVITAMATVHGVTSTIEQEILLSTAEGARVWRPQSPDEGYGGGHNNDNTSVALCISNYQQAQQGGKK